MADHRFAPAIYHTTLGPHDPVLTIESGDRVATTVDAGGFDAADAAVTRGGNPQTGPFRVAGAEPGDTLAVHLRMKGSGIPTTPWRWRQYMEMAPGLALWPGLCLTLTVYSLNMFGDAMRDLLDPRLRGGGGRLGADAARSRCRRANLGRQGWRHGWTSPSIRRGYRGGLPVGDANLVRAHPQVHGGPRGSTGRSG